jgi:N6-L-threonylcarbamoyladenine synthase
MIKKGLDFSFSGLKTSVLYHLQEQDQGYVEKHIDDLCASVSAAISDVLVIKLRRAVRKTGVNHVMVAGGVSANSMLREKVQAMAKKERVSLMIPAMEYCTDNAAMIAKAGEMKARLDQYDGMELKPFASLK